MRVRRSDPVGGRRRIKRARRARTVTIDGQAYAIVWDGHRNGKTLLEYRDSDHGADHTLERGRLGRFGHSKHGAEDL